MHKNFFVKYIGDLVEVGMSFGGDFIFRKWKIKRFIEGQRLVLMGFQKVLDITNLMLFLVRLPELQSFLPFKIWSFYYFSLILVIRLHKQIIIQIIKNCWRKVFENMKTESLAILWVSDQSKSYK
jgi:hypothetical protein